jgi:AcrR family transcriptional regulator
MPKPATLGRPSKSAKAVTKEKVHQVAFRLINQSGLDALTFRALAKQLDVTPMAITHHVGTRKQLLVALIAFVFSDIGGAAKGATPKIRLRYLLNRYCERAIENSHLIPAMLADHSLISEGLSLFTDQIRNELETFVDAETVTPILNLIIDYTHGFVSAVAAAQENNGPNRKEYNTSIDWVLNQL